MENKIELWEEPRLSLLEKKSFQCQMSNYDHSVLCGMLRKCKPSKILEIGVAEGGTTAVIVQALSMMGCSSEMWSVDLNERFYQDDTYQTGYEYENLKSNICMNNVKHSFVWGGVAENIEEIGGQIDFAVIDTTHQLPGEILDFLCILPYLSKNATVVLHDVDLNYRRMVFGNSRLKKYARECVSTKILFTTVVGEKYEFYDGQKMGNIAAFNINEDTMKYIKSLFYALSLTWSYLPDEELLDGYRKVYKEIYDRDCLDCFEKAVRNNKEMIKCRDDVKTYMDIVEERKLIRGNFLFPYEKVPVESKVALYGAGKVGKDFYQQIKDHFDVVTWVDHDYERVVSEVSSTLISINSPKQLYECDFDYVVVAIADEKIANSVCQELIDKGIAKEKVIWKRPWNI